MAACGGKAIARHLSRVWFEHQIVHLAGLDLVPADLVATVAADLQPAGLWWDTTPLLADDLYDWQTQAAVLPSVRLAAWDGLQLALPGDVVLDAAIADPRLAVETKRRVRGTRAGAARTGAACSGVVRRRFVESSLARGDRPRPRAIAV